MLHLNHWTVHNNQKSEEPNQVFNSRVRSFTSDLKGQVLWGLWLGVYVYIYIHLYACKAWPRKKHVILVFLSYAFPPLASRWFVNWCLFMSFDRLAICFWLTSGLDGQILTLQPFQHRKAVKVCIFVVGNYVPWSPFDRDWLSAERWTHRHTGTPTQVKSSFSTWQRRLSKVFDSASIGSFVLLHSLA